MTSERLREAIAERGGLANQGDLHRQWGLGRTRVSELVQMDGFPRPLGYAGGKAVWLIEECNEWRRERFGRL